MEGNRRPGVIDEELLPGLVFLPQHHVQLLPPLLVEFAEPAVAVAVGVSLPILLPGQLQRQMGIPLEFFMETRKIRSGLVAVVDAPRGPPEQGRFQLALLPAFWQRPTDTRRLRAFQVFINRAVPDRAAAGDLSLAQS
jgi:hypothetical protein